MTMRNGLFLVVCGLSLSACGGATDGSGGSGLSNGGAGGTSASGGASAGGSTASGGTVGAGGSIDCSMAGCSAPPMCETGCTAPCGCCPCSDGQTMGNRVCQNGCYALTNDAGMGTCDHGGYTYAVGDTYYASDGCNTCTCTVSGSACTKIACVCDPVAEERKRNYVGNSPSQCALIDFMCPANTTYFGNDCGCGCQQSTDCPEWFDCMPSPGGPACDTAWIAEHCPYSGIAY